MIVERFHERDQLRSAKEVQASVAVVIRQRSERLGAEGDTLMQSITSTGVE